MITKEELREATRSSKRVIKFPPAIGDWTLLHPQKPTPKKVRRGLYNFDRLSEDELKSAHLLHYQLLDRLLAELKNELWMSSELYNVSADQLSYVDFVEGIISPIVQFTIQFGSRRDQGILLLDLPLAHAILHHALGFRNQEPGVMQSITEKEGQILQATLQSHAKTFGRLWGETMGNPTFQMRGSTTFNPALTASPTDTFVVFEGEATFGESPVGKIQIGYLATFLRTLLLQRKRERKSRPASFWLPSSILSELNAEIVTHLGKTTLTAAELEQLEAGDVIALDTKIDQMLPVSIGDQEVLRGVPGISHGKLAVRCFQAQAAPAEHERIETMETGESEAEQMETEEETFPPTPQTEEAEEEIQEEPLEEQEDEFSENLEETTGEAGEETSEEGGEENPFKF